jgi:hypothetical protein
MHRRECRTCNGSILVPFLLVLDVFAGEQKRHSPPISETAVIKISDKCNIEIIQTTYQDSSRHSLELKSNNPEEELESGRKVETMKES